MSTALRIAVAGTGRMGKAVEACAVERGHRIIERFDEATPVTAEALTCVPDVVIDFTLPHVAISHMTHYCTTRTPAVIGTTGWYEHMDQVRQLVASYEATILYSPNYSLGIQLILQAIRIMGPLLDQLPEFDIAVQETHHTAKMDSPSGTAIQMATRLAQNLQRKHTSTSPSTSSESSQLEVTATRLGHVFGQHRIMIDGPADQIMIEHTAKHRGGFALGAVRAAEWIQGRTGLFTLEDMLAEWLAVHTKSHV